MSGARRGKSNQFDVVEQNSLGLRQPGFVELALKNGGYALIVCSLNTQEVGMAVQSIRAAIQVGYVAGNHLLVAAREMTFGKVDRIGKLDDLAQKIRPRAKALYDSGDLLSSRARAPKVVGGGYVAGDFGVFDDSDLGALPGLHFRVCHQCSTSYGACKCH